MTKHIEILAEGEGELLGWHDPDENRAWVRDHKPRGLFDKRMSVPEAVRQFVKDGDYLAVGGFGHIRTPIAFVYEIIRQGITKLYGYMHSGGQALDLLVGAGCAGGGTGPRSQWPILPSLPLATAPDRRPLRCMRITL